MTKAVFSLPVRGLRGAARRPALRGAARRARGRWNRSGVALGVGRSRFCLRRRPKASRCSRGSSRRRGSITSRRRMRGADELRACGHVEGAHRVEVPLRVERDDDHKIELNLFDPGATKSAAAPLYQHPLTADFWLFPTRWMALERIAVLRTAVGEVARSTRDAARLARRAHVPRHLHRARAAHGSISGR